MTGSICGTVTCWSEKMSDRNGHSNYMMYLLELNYTVDA